MPDPRLSECEAAISRADSLRAAGVHDLALTAYLEAVAPIEQVTGTTCVKIARAAQRVGDHDRALSWLLRACDDLDDAVAWQAAAGLLAKIEGDVVLPSKRAIKLAIIGSSTTTQLAAMTRLAGLRFGMDISLYEGGYGQYQQEILDPESALYAFDPDVLLIAVHEGTIPFDLNEIEPEDALDREVTRWHTLWETFADRCNARIVMHNIALPLTNSFGHLAPRLPGARQTLLRALNQRLGVEAGSTVSVVDCERIAAGVGKDRWFDDRYWHLSKQAVSIAAVPVLAWHTVSVIAADQGLARKCLVLDLDNTLWGGVIGEAGVNGIQLGDGPIGDAFVQFQQWIASLQKRGVILAVCSKNNDADAREPFEKHPDMVLKLEDIAMFVANWEPKPANIEHIARTLNIGVDSIVFVDDNPAEREIVRQMLPDVEVITLPDDPSGYTRALATSPWFESANFTSEDARRNEQYRGRAQVAELEAGATSLEDFHRSLQMQAIVAPFDDLHLPRIVQLIGKTNQFNLTTRRHTLATVRQFMADADCVHLYLKLSDRFADHGLVSLAIATRVDDVLDIDTWLMSCRVIGRTVEAAMLTHLCAAATRLGCTALRGTYLPTPKNVLVKDVYSRFGFEPGDGDGVWVYDLAANGPIENGLIQSLTSGGQSSDAA